MATLPSNDRAVRTANRDLGKSPNLLKRWQANVPVSASKLNKGVDAINRIIGPVGIPYSSKDGTRRPSQLYIATESRTSEDQTIKARKINPEGEEDQPEVEYAKPKGVGIGEGQKCILVVAGMKRPTLHPVGGAAPLFVAQANASVESLIVSVKPVANAADGASEADAEDRDKLQTQGIRKGDKCFPVVLEDGTEILVPEAGWNAKEPPKDLNGAPEGWDYLSDEDDQIAKGFEVDVVVNCVFGGGIFSQIKRRFTYDASGNVIKVGAEFSGTVFTTTPCP